MTKEEFFCYDCFQGEFFMKRICIALLFLLLISVCSLMASPIYKSFAVNGETVSRWVVESSVVEFDEQGNEIHFKMSSGFEYWYEYDTDGNEIHFKLYNATKDEQLADTDVEICKDGRRYYVKAGETIVLRPGESLSLYPYYYHEFIIPKNGKGPALIGEVSMCNDDNTDNRFLKPLGRFPTIEEDEPAYRLLCTEYPAAKD